MDFGFQSGPNIGLTGNLVPGSNSGPFGAYLPKFGGGDFNIYGSNSTFGNEYIWDPEKRKWIKISNVGEEYYHNYIVGRWNENGAYEVFYNLDYNPRQDWRINGTLFTQAQVFKMGLYDKNLSKYLLKSDYGVEYMKYSIRNNPNSEFFLTYGSMLIMGFVSPTSYVPLAVRGGVGAIQLAKGVQVATAAKTSSRILNMTTKQLQTKFKHAADFGVTGNWNKAAASKFSSAINQHINSSGVKIINGTYRGQPAVHYLNPNTGLNVISRPNGQFWSGWKLNTGQLQNVLQHGGL